MYKQDITFLFRSLTGWSIGYLQNFETKEDFDIWMQDRLKDGLVYEGEKQKEIEVYPQVLKLNLKYSLGGYSTVIEYFKDSEDYKKYCDWKLSQGYKIIGSEPYMKLKKENEEDQKNESVFGVRRTPKR